MKTSDTCYCTFCGISQHGTLVLVAGPVRTFICDGCVALCAEIVEEKRTEILRARGCREMLWGDLGITPEMARGWCK